MKYALKPYLAALLLITPIASHATIYECSDGKGGITYQNVGEEQGCKKAELRPLTTVNFPKAEKKVAKKDIPAGKGKLKDAMMERAIEGTPEPEADEKPAKKSTAPLGGLKKLLDQ